MIKTEMDSMPAEMDELSRRIMQLEIEEAALKKETDRLSKDRLEDLQKELAELRDSFHPRKHSGKMRNPRWINYQSCARRLSILTARSRQPSRPTT